MATTLSSPSVQATIRCQLQTGAAPAIVGSSVVQTPNTTLGVGSIAGSVNRCISEAATVTSGTPFTFNVSSGLDPLGTAAGFVHLVAIMVTNLSTVAGQDLTVGAGTDPVMGTDSDLVQANGGVLYKVNPNPGWAVVGGTSDVLTITVAAGTAVPFQITLLGRSA